MNHSPALNKNNIIAELYQSKEIAAMLSKHDGGGGNDDLKSELFLALLNYPDEKIIEAHKRNELLFITTGIVQRMLFQKGSKFHRQFRQTVYEYSEATLRNPDDKTELEYKQRKEDGLHKMQECIQTDLDFCEQVAVQAYLREGTKGMAVKKTGLPERSFRLILNNGIKKIKSGVMGKTIGSYVYFNVEFIIDCEENVNAENINDLMDEFLEFMKYKMEKKSIPNKRSQTNYIKEIKEARLKSII